MHGGDIKFTLQEKTMEPARYGIMRVVRYEDTINRQGLFDQFISAPEELRAKITCLEEETRQIRERLGPPFTQKGFRTEFLCLRSSYSDLMEDVRIAESDLRRYGRVLAMADRVFGKGSDAELKAGIRERMGKLRRIVSEAYDLNVPGGELPTVSISCGEPAPDRI
jgi:hypothetical protein